MWIKSLLLIVAAITISGCATVGSHDLNSAAQATTRGQVYYLPKVVFIVGIHPNAANDDLVFEAHPYYVADIAAGPLVLRHTQGWFTEDEVKTPIDQRSLMQTVDFTANSRADVIFRNIGVLAAQRALTTNYITSDVVDPADPYDLARSAVLMNAGLQEWGAQARPEASASAQEMRAYRRSLAGRAAAMNVALDWTWEGETRSAETPNPTTVPRAAPPGPVAGAPAGACAIGVCVRAARPGRLRLYRNGVLVGAYQASIPNRAPRTVIPVQGGVFANRSVKIEFDNGLPVQVQAHGGNELEGAVTAAVDTVASFGTATVDRVRGRTALYNDDTARIRARAQRAQALRTEAAGQVPDAPAAPGAGSGQNPAPSSQQSGQTPEQPIDQTQGSNGQDANSQSANGNNAGATHDQTNTNGARQQAGANQATQANRASETNTNTQDATAGGDPAGAGGNVRSAEGLTGLDTWVISLTGPRVPTASGQTGASRTQRGHHRLDQ